MESVNKHSFTMGFKQGSSITMPIADGVAVKIQFELDDADAVGTVSHLTLGEVQSLLVDDQEKLRKR